MKKKLPHFLPLAAVLLLLFCAPAPAEQHRATHLGNPDTRFAPPLATPEDLRARFHDPKLQPDFDTVLKQWGWHGNKDDLFAAAATEEIVEWPIAVGTTMPFMSTREKGKPVCLRNVTWAGKAPAPAYAFVFTSNGQRYRCITPKACSNFFLEDLGPIPRPVLALQCEAPAEGPVGRAVEVCLTVINNGNATEPKTLLTLPIPPGAILSSTTDNPLSRENPVTWQIPDLAPRTGKKVCAYFKMRQPGTLAFAPVATGTSTNPASSACETKVVGVAGILLEVVDTDDPVELGKETTYVIKVTNQGSATGTNIRIVCTLPATQEFVSTTGVTPGQATGSTVTMESLPSLASRAEATWRVVVKAAQTGDSRFRAELSSDQFEKPISEDEATQQY